MSIPRWLVQGLPCIRQALTDLGPDAALAVYTDGPGTELISAAVPEATIRPLPIAQIVSGFDHCDQAHADALDRALAGNYAVVPLVADQVFGRGSLCAARRVIESAGKRAATAVLIPSREIWPTPSCAELCDLILRQGGLLPWSRQPWSSHPGHMAWRSASGAVLVRMIYVPPLLIVPERAHSPIRAIDHFMMEGYLSDFDSIHPLQPSEACMVGIQGPAGPAVPEVGAPLCASAKFVADWGRNGNMQSWNARLLTHCYWIGDPGPDREALETASGEIVAEIERLYHA